MQKNVASQSLLVFAFDSTTNLPKTGDAANLTAYVSIDWGAVTVLGDTSATELDATNAKGYYVFSLAQAETNGNTLLFTAKSATSNIVVLGAPAVVQTVPAAFVIAGGAAGGLFIAGTNAATTVTTSFTTTFTGNLTGSVGSVTGLTASNLDATITSRMATYTQPTGFLSATFPAGTVANTTNITAGTITTVTNLTNAATAGDFTATMKTSIGTAVAASAVASVTGNVGGNVTGSVGSIATGGIAAASFAAGAIDAAALAADAGTEIATAVWASGTRTLTAGTNIVLAKGVGVTGFNDITAAAAATAVLTTQMTEGYATGAFTVSQALYEIAQVVGQFSITGTTLTMQMRDASTPAGTFTLDSATAPTSRTRAT